MQTPKEKHPIFYGCFDWHSAVHGHWLMASAANRFPGTDLANQIEAIFDEQFTAEKVTGELVLFNQDGSQLTLLTGLFNSAQLPHLTTHAK